MQPTGCRPIGLATTIRALVALTRRHPGDVERVLAALTELAESIAPTAGPVKTCPSCGASYDTSLPLVGVSKDGPATEGSSADQAAVRMVVEGLGRDPADELLVREGLGVPAGTPADGLPRRTFAVPEAAPAPADPARAPVCEACGEPLSQEQLSRGARSCSPACRARASRQRAVARKLAVVTAGERVRGDAMRVLRDLGRVLEELRAEIARG